MAVTLAALTTRLSDEVTAVDSVPSAGQYSSAVKDAVAAFSNRTGFKKLHEFSVVSGTAAYTLPDDYLKLIKFESLYGNGAWYGDDLVTGQGIIPMNSAMYEERHTIAGKTLTLHPTPTYSSTRYLWYKAGHTLDGDQAYPDMTDEMIPIVIAKAQANIWRMIAARVSRSDGWKYQVGDVMIDKSNVGKALSTWVSDYDTEFEALVKAYVGTVGKLA